MNPIMRAVQVLCTILGLVMLFHYFTIGATKDMLEREAQNPQYDAGHRASDYDFWGRKVH